MRTPDYTATKTPMQGVRIWDNPKNKFTVFELHYSADPEKRAEAWKEAAKSGMPIRKWKQEYELEWLSYKGVPVYGDWNRSLHLSNEILKPHIGLPLLIGFDFGLCAAAVVGQLQGDTLVILREYTSLNMGAERFSDYVISQNKIHFPRWASRKYDWLCFIDPAGEFRKDTDEGTCAQVLDSKGFNPVAGPVSFEARRMAVEDYLTGLTKAGPKFQVNERLCRLLVKGFDGGYAYPEKSVELEATKLRPVKNIFSHVHDALQYLCHGVTNANLQLRRRGAMPRPSYKPRRR